jgi:deazaflavin-dependent oxidoreductase (nitroreductase family)
MLKDAQEFNAAVITEFRANQGRVAGSWEGTPLLLHHTGGTSGVSRVTPVGYLGADGRYVIFASNGGAPTSPAWYHNLKAYPNTSIEVGNETIDVVAQETTGKERERLFAIGAQRFPQLSEHAQKTDRIIPVVVLTPRPSAPDRRRTSGAGTRRQRLTHRLERVEAIQDGAMSLGATGRLTW